MGCSPSGDRHTRQHRLTARQVCGGYFRWADHRTHRHHPRVDRLCAAGWFRSAGRRAQGVWAGRAAADRAVPVPSWRGPHAALAAAPGRRPRRRAGRAPAGPVRPVAAGTEAGTAAALILTAAGTAAVPNPAAAAGAAAEDGRPAAVAGVAAAEAASSGAAEAATAAGSAAAGSESAARAGRPGGSRPRAERRPGRGGRPYPAPDHRVRPVQVRRDRSARPDPRQGLGPAARADAATSRRSRAPARAPPPAARAAAGPTAAATAAAAARPDRLPSGRRHARRPRSHPRHPDTSRARRSCRPGSLPRKAGGFGRIPLDRPRRPTDRSVRVTCVNGACASRLYRLAGCSVTGSSNVSAP